MAMSPKTTTPAVSGADAAPSIPSTSAQDADLAEDRGVEVTLLKRELFARVVAATDAKKPQVKQIVEATLAIIGQALADGEALNLPPLGKVRIVRSRDAGSAEVITLKLRRKGRSAALGAEDEES
ncbi:hypothetical protein GCM10008024_24050 [Allgaiera indica]|uniref:DNA-binding protein n=1 Tax=Allgaiera indica TaxID=765699 RepID=A0AAN4UT48_9RHOB|nr:HU family DNA-binding protein [Allgaiera indica]GHE02856.1 hypothetical protein GCM10008024_24050 [Allgaiera indica]SDX16764.1 DNA-binding protein [Allgaiera indica]